MNRKGDERVLILYWFIIFIIISIAIISGVISFYGHPLDIREKESEILSSKMIDCITDNGRLNTAISLSKEEFLDNCNLFFKDESNTEYVDKTQYYIEIKINEEVRFKEGNEDYLAFCKQEESKLRIPICNTKKFYILENDNIVNVEVLSAIRKVEQNAK